ncbi:hypothetical protein [Edaphobacter modestus]|uniref:Uncharacterized protein n=1 Tax=Edaphobacter modestus TaxID=388466 RepID=A0A4V2G1E5_9BACT|nr:hypothetical protein [Edaphobacter modestus]RZU28916.1 hypothetical protein BDD14_6501 [Edaphobacter modestus]
MGDKAVVSIKQETDGNGPNLCINLHAHWKGPHVAIDLREGLNRGRWDQTGFLAKNILCEIVRGFEDDDCRHGISASVWTCSEDAEFDLDRPLIMVDPAAQTVTIQGHPSIPFPEYIELSDEKLLTLMGGCLDGPDCPACASRREFYAQYPFKEDVGVFHKPPFEKLINPARRIREDLIEGEDSEDAP